MGETLATILKVREVHGNSKGREGNGLACKGSGNEPCKPIRHVAAALAVLSNLEGRSSLAKPVRKISGAARRKIATSESAVAKWRSSKKL